MAHDVFVSYPTEDKTTADAVVSVLERRGIRCWVAPRDVQPGREWASAIVDAISRSSMMVLVFSGATNNSQHILREVREAANADIPIMPFRTTEVEPSSALRYYIGGTHWLDALTEPLSRHLEELATRVSAHLADRGGELPLVPRPAPVSGPAPRRTLPTFVVPPLAWKIAGGVAAAALVTVLGFWLFGPDAAAPDDTVAAAPATTTSTVKATTTEAPVSMSALFVPSLFAAAYGDGSAQVCYLGFVPTHRVLDDSFGGPVCEQIDTGADRWFFDVALADFNNDTALDVVWATSAGEDGTGSASNVRCLWEDGWQCSGFDRFEDQRASGREMATRSVATGDLNADGFVDVVFGNSDPPPNETRLRAEVCYGTDGGTGFRCWMLPDAEVADGVALGPWGITDIEIGDVDQDGSLDVVLTGPDAAIEVCYGSGDGEPTFTCVELESERGKSFQQVAVGDLDADGLTDLLFASPGTPPRWCRGVGDRSLACEDIGPGDSRNFSVLIADLDEDGSLDAVFGRAGGAGSGFSGYMAVCPGPLVSGAGCEQSLVAGTSGFDVWMDPIAVDFTGDGVLDLLWQDPIACRGYAMNGGFECEFLEFAGGATNFAWAPTG